VRFTVSDLGAAAKAAAGGSGENGGVLGTRNLELHAALDSEAAVARFEGLD